MAIGRPAIETAAAEVAGPAAAVAWVAAIFVATIPKFGRPAVADFTVSVAVCAFEEAGGPTVKAAPRCAVARLAAGEAAISPCGAVVSAVGVCDTGALPGVVGPAAAVGEGPGLPAPMSAVAVVVFGAGCVVGPPD